MRSEVKGSDSSAGNGHAGGQRQNGTFNGHHHHQSERGGGSNGHGNGRLQREIALYELDPKDRNIKVVIRNGHIVEGEDTLPFRHFKKTRTQRPSERNGSTAGMCYFATEEDYNKTL